MEEQGLLVPGSPRENACCRRQVAGVVEATPALQGTRLREAEEAVDALYYWQPLGHYYILCNSPIIQPGPVSMRSGDILLLRERKRSDSPFNLSGDILRLRER